MESRLNDYIQRQIESHPNKGVNSQQTSLTFDATVIKIEAQTLKKTEFTSDQMVTAEIPALPLLRHRFQSSQIRNQRQQRRLSKMRTIQKAQELIAGLSESNNKLSYQIRMARRQNKLKVVSRLSPIQGYRMINLSQEQTQEPPPRSFFKKLKPPRLSRRPNITFSPVPKRNTINFSEITDQIVLNPLYKYCKVCYDPQIKISINSPRAKSTFRN